MTDFKKKYLKYKEKYLKLKQFGGEKKIIYNEEILDFIKKTIVIDDVNSFNNLKEAVYSCIYMNMTDMKGACEITARTVNCSVLSTSNFPFFTSSGFDFGNCKFIEDKLNNNLIIIFGSGSVLYCDHFIKQLYVVFIRIYEKILDLLAKNPKYKFIHIVGHSMGASLSILFSYFIMIIEKSAIDHMYVPSADYFFVNYDLKRTYEFGDVGEYLFPDYLSEICPDLTVEYDKESNFEVIREKTNDFLTKGYPKIGHKISVCSVGAFPVLFKITDKTQYEEYLSFYKNRIIIFGNCDSDAKPIPPNINANFCDDKIFNMILKNSSDDSVISELTNFSYVNINNLSIMNTADTLIKLNFTLADKKIKKGSLPYEQSQITMSSELHNYINNYRKLKRFVEVIDE